MVALLGVLGDAGEGWDHMGGWEGGWMWVWGVVMMALFVVLLVWLVRTAGASPASREPMPRDPSDRGREILAERYARGELSTEEYRERASELR